GYLDAGPIGSGGSGTQLFNELPGGFLILVEDDQGVAARDFGAQVLGHGKTLISWKDSPIRPRPMKPHVAKAAGVEEKDRLGVDEGEPSLEVENRTEIAALMVT
ncbi:MAG: hypothetical protein L6R35_004359, partial [Caloplaca aegaea]